MKNEQLQKQWLKLDRMHKDLLRMIYRDKDSRADDLRKAAALIKGVLDNMKEEIEK